MARYIGRTRKTVMAWCGDDGVSSVDNVKGV